ncbi:adenylate isopentenyltransferase 5, chloroplastic-like [Vicia villosa]|uniref:adenylate isopentenyltransferase 5, chloroplastic-like n=1 Tax=Vicia villosa TaxID=3911 RepID=UPI00273B61E0|nr:adenylate isopentenyltransferase 5, chloroplastic-like [Vicia villosa]
MMNIFSVSAAVSSACKPMVRFQPPLMDNDNLRFQQHRKEKVVVVMGATGTGKSKLAIDLANHFPPAEIINSDKMQVYKGLDITTNKVTEEECRGVPHHLLGTIDPDSSYAMDEFCEDATLAIGSILGRDGLPIIAGGSNSFIEGLVNHHHEFRMKYECCFLWVDVSIPVLHSSLSARVDRMIEAGQVNEVREFFNQKDFDYDYTRGIRRAIGVPEFDEFFRAESEGVTDGRTMKKLLEVAIDALKVNNCMLASKQVKKIHRLYGMWKRNMHRLDATEVVLKEDNWEDRVLAKSLRIVHKFLYEDCSRVTSGGNGGGGNGGVIVPAKIASVAGVTH